MTPEQIISEAYRAFSSFSRPEHFTDHAHCEECAEHDQTMLSCSLAELSSAQVGNPGWSPIPLLTDEAYGYVMPRLLELALTSRNDDPFVFQYLLALTPAPEHRKLDHFTSEQATAVLGSLYYIRDHMAALVETECCDSDLAEAVARWQTLAAKGPSKAMPGGSP